MRFARASALVSVAAAAAYANAVPRGFVLDDYHFIVENDSLNIGFSWFWRAYVASGVEFYRPLSTVMFAIDHALFAGPAGYHFVNLIWHIAASVLFLAFSRRLIDERGALAAALIFAVHPIHTEAVTGIVGRMEVMAAVFVLAGALFHASARRVAALVCCLLALWSKESGVALPLVAFLVDARSRGARAALRRALPFAIPLAVYAFLRITALSSSLPRPAAYFVVAGAWRGFFTAVDVLGRDLLLMMWPHPLSADYSYQALPISTGPLDVRTALTILALIALTIAAVRARTIGAALFAVTILPVSNLVIRIGVLMAERLLYLPSIGICLIAGGLLAKLPSRVFAPALAALAIALGALTIDRNLDWDNPLVLWRDTVEKQPKSGLAHANLALSCNAVGDCECALRELRIAVELDPSREDFRFALEALLR